MTDPTVRSDIAPHLAHGGGTRDAALDLNAAAQRVRDRVVQALSAVFPRGTHLKISNIVIQDGKIDAGAIVLEVRRP